MEENLKQQFLGKVIKVGEKGGSSGNLTSIKLELLHNNRRISRIVKGRVTENDTIALLECEREHRRMR